MTSQDSNMTSPQRRCHEKISPCTKNVFLVILLILLFVISWKAISSAISHMQKINLTARDSEVQKTIFAYSDILVAVISSIIVALLSITITMYVFLKSALDRIIDENSYITFVARAYQDKTSKELFTTTLLSSLSLFFELLCYSILRFQNVLNGQDYKLLKICTCCFVPFFVFALTATANFWVRCLNMRKRLSRLIEEMKCECSNKLVSSFENKEDNIYFLIGYWSEWETSQVDDIIAMSDGNFPNLAMQDNRDIIGLIDKGQKFCKDLTADQFINLFSRIEVLLMSGVGGFENSSSRKYSESDIITVIQERSDISTPTIRVENEDMKSLKYRSAGEVLQYIDSFRSQIGFSRENESTHAKNLIFFQSTKSLYLTLKEYRDLIISERYVEDISITNSRRFQNSQKSVNSQQESGIELDITLGLGMYYFFLRVLGLFVSAVTIKDFTFNGNVLNFANFYNSTLENVSFYAAEFYHTIFARTKLINVSMDLSKIDNVFFYYTRLTDTSLSNTEFSNVNFENIQMQNCDLSICIFTNCSITNSNLTNNIFNGSLFHDSQLSASVFSQSKLENILIEGTSLTGCDFSDANLKNWVWKNRKADICLKNCICTSSTWENMDIAIADLSNSVFNEAAMPFTFFFEVNLTEALFRKCQLAYAEFINCEKLCRSSFVEANLYGANFECCDMQYSSFFRANASYTKFESCIIMNGDCAEAYFRGATVIKTSFENARLYNATFDWAEINGCWFKSALADHVQFTSAKCEESCFQYTSMTDCSFSGSIFKSCDFTGADLSDSAATDLMFKQCRLNQTDFSRIKFADCVFESAESEVQCCTFNGSIFSCAENGGFYRLVFESCFFDQTQFSGWKFQNVVFRNCSFRESTFSMCFFDSVSFDHCSTVSNGRDQLLTSYLFVENHFRPITNELPPSADISFDEQPITQ